MRTPVLVATATIIAALSGPAFSAESITGTWARSAGQCRNAQDNPNAPLVIGNGRLDQHEAHCTFGKLRDAGPGAWAARGSCSIEGDAQRGSFRFRLSGRQLTVTLPDGVSSTYRRC